MRGLLAFSCRAFPPEHRARRSDEIVDTALLAADGSLWRTARESLSLVRAGMRDRVRAEPRRSPHDGVGLLARLLALVNLAVALYGISFAVNLPPPPGIIGRPASPSPTRMWSIGGGLPSPSRLPGSFSAWRSATARSRSARRS